MLVVSFLFSFTILIFLALLPIKEEIIEGSHTNSEKSFSPIEVVLTGKIFMFMTYGRLLIKNTDTSSEYKYFIIEPNDIISEGVSRYSPTTMNIKYTDIVKIKGSIEHVESKCWWNEIEYEGCVPLVSLESVEVTS